MKHFFQWGPMATSHTMKIQIMKTWDEYIEKRSEQIEELARDIVVLSRREAFVNPSSPWTPQGINKELKIWEKGISAEIAPYRILDFVKRHAIRGRSRAFWIQRCPDGQFLSDKLLLLLEAESVIIMAMANSRVGEVNEFNVKLGFRKDIFGYLINKVFGYIEFA